jgi:hypothetical protein
MRAGHFRRPGPRTAIRGALLACFTIYRGTLPYRQGRYAQDMGVWSPLMMSDIGEYPAPIRAMVRLPLEARLWSALRDDPNQSVRMLARRLETQPSRVHPALTRLLQLGLLSYEVRACGKRPPRYRVNDHSETEQPMT